MSTSAESLWVPYAVTGRPDFLNYLRQGDVTWEDLWAYYRAAPADPGAMLRLSGLFHIFLSHEFDRDGCVLDREGSVYAALSGWARFVADSAEFLPEHTVCGGLSSLLADSLISPLYFEAAFSTYVEALIRCGAVPAVDVNGRQSDSGPDCDRPRLRLLLPDQASSADAGLISDHLVPALRSHYQTWNVAFQSALGQETEGWLDEGGEG